MVSGNLFRLPFVLPCIDGAAPAVYADEISRFDGMFIYCRVFINLINFEFTENNNKD